MRRCHVQQEQAADGYTRVIKRCHVALPRDINQAIDLANYLDNTRRRETVRTLLTF